MRSTEFLPDYTEVRELGHGAQGRVVLARHTGSTDLVAIKYLAPELMSDERHLSDFQREAAILAQVTDPNIAKIHRYLQTDGQAAIVMEAVDGVSLKRVLQENGALEPESALAVLKGSLLGLNTAHEMGIVHRDYKPANVMVTEDGQSKLIDFGIAALTGERSMMGTPNYMAPEQWQDGEATPATDVYSATCVFYECVTGKVPFSGSNFAELAAKHTGAPIPLEDVPVELRDLVSSGMAKHAASRPPHARAFVDHLEHVAAEAYGTDWERRGLIALATGTAALAMLFPLALLSGGGGQASTAIASTSLGGGAGKSGLLAKFGAGKATIAGASAITVGVTAVYLLNGPEVGGTTSSVYDVWFERPGAVTGNATIPDGSRAGPSARITTTVTPARVEAGTKVRLRFEINGKSPWGLEYISEGHYRCHEPKRETVSPYHRSFGWGLGSTRGADIKEQPNTRIWLFEAPRKPTVLPTTPMTSIPALGSREKDIDNGYSTSDCAYLQGYVDVHTFTIPKNLKPGRYFASPFNPPSIGSTRIPDKQEPENAVSVAPSSVGATSEGTLPVLTVLG